MEVLVISASPKKDGLTAACAAAAVQGVLQGGGHAAEVRLNDLDIAKCHACGNGWGACRTDHKCQEEDGFQALHARIPAFDSYVLVTPVYWWEMSESMKAFTDRLRRCEGTAGSDSHFMDKPVVAVAAAGGSGSGMITCLASMEHWIKHVRGRVFDLIPVNRWSREYKCACIRQAARAMVEEEGE